MDKSVFHIFLALCFDVVSLALIKAFLGGIAFPDFVFVRSILSFIFLGLFNVSSLFKFQKNELVLIFFRACAGCASFLCLLVSLRELPLSTTIPIFNTSPLFIITFSCLFYKHPLLLHHMLGIVLSLVGCGFFVYSNITFRFDSTLLWPLSSALLYGFSLAITKAILKTPPASIQTLYCLLCGAAFFPFIQPSKILAHGYAFFLIITLLALLNLAMNYLYIRGYQEGDVRSLSALEYLSIPLALLVGAGIWEEYPNTLEAIACGFIIIGGIIATRTTTR